MQTQLFDFAKWWLDLERWGGFLRKWSDCLESYGTTPEFVYPTSYRQLPIEFSSGIFGFVCVTSPNNALRRELMKTQERYIPKNSKYAHRTDISKCFLCQNVAQGIDHAEDPNYTGNNLIDRVNDFFIMPNRYPSLLGHSLLVPINHDLTECRVNPAYDPATGNAMYPSEPGKTRGNLISDADLASAIEACDKHHLAGLRNHTLDAMSIPFHDHFHLMPMDLIPFSMAEKIAQEKAETDFGAQVYTLRHTPFSTLLVQAEKSDGIPEVAGPLLRRMELQNEVFTLVYHGGKLFVSPRNKEMVGDSRQSIGSGVAVHYLDNDSASHLEKLRALVPLQGRYDWKKLFL